MPTPNSAISNKGNCLRRMMFALAGAASVAGPAAAQPVFSPDPPKGYTQAAEPFGMDCAISNSNCSRYGEIFSGPSGKLAVRLSIISSEGWPALWTICESDDRGARAYLLNKPRDVQQIAAEPLKNLGVALKHESLNRDTDKLSGLMRIAEDSCLKKPQL